MTIQEDAQELIRSAKAIDTNGIAYNGDLASLVVDRDTGQPFHPPLLLGTVRAPVGCYFKQTLITPSGPRASMPKSPKCTMLP